MGKLWSSSDGQFAAAAIPKSWPCWLGLADVAVHGGHIVPTASWNSSELESLYFACKSIAKGILACLEGTKQHDLACYNPTQYSD